MSVEQLIERLQKLPQHYECMVFVRGIEVDDCSSDIVDVVTDVEIKQVLIEFDPTMLKP